MWVVEQVAVAIATPAGCRNLCHDPLERTHIARPPIHRTADVHIGRGGGTTAGSNSSTLTG
nr:hypothetical protein ISGA_5474 [Gordonia sp. NB41Y]